MGQSGSHDQQPFEYASIRYFDEYGAPLHVIYHDSIVAILIPWHSGHSPPVLMSASCGELFRREAVLHAKADL